MDREEAWPEGSIVSLKKLDLQRKYSCYWRLSRAEQVERNIPVSPVFPAPHFSASASLMGWEMLPSGVPRSRAEKSEDQIWEQTGPGPVLSSKHFVHSFTSSETSGTYSPYRTITPPPLWSPYLTSALSPPIFTNRKFDHSLPPWNALFSVKRLTLALNGWPLSV